MMLVRIILVPNQTILVIFWQYILAKRSFGVFANGYHKYRVHTLIF
jgi:hypothetical protein